MIDMVKLSYASGTSSKPLLGCTIGEKIDEIVKLYQDNDALIVHQQNINWSYTKLQKEVNQCAKALMFYGLQKGDRVGIWAPNKAEWTVLQFAKAKAGVILVNINPSYRLHELEYVLNQSECKMIVIAEKFKKSNYEEMMMELAPLGP